MTNEEFIQSIALDGEEWRDVIGWEGLYKVSSYGRIATMSRTIQVGHGWRTTPYSIISPTIGKIGYKKVCLFRNGKRKYVNVHRLVAQAFIPNPEHKPTVDHIDRNRQNNFVSNLRWCTLSENMHNPNTVEHCRTMNHPERPENYVPVVALVKGSIVKQYSSIKDAVKDGYVHCAIVNVCAGRRKTHRGLQWMYLSDYETLISKSKNS